jgi:hypothetical protein
MCSFNSHGLLWHSHLYIIWRSCINDIRKECFEYLAVQEKYITCYRHFFFPSHLKPVKPWENDVLDVLQARIALDNVGRAKSLFYLHINLSLQ